MDVFFPIYPSGDKSKISYACLYDSCYHEKDDYAVASRKEFRDEDECKKYTKELAEKHDLEYRPSISSETKHDYLD